MASALEEAWATALAAPASATEPWRVLADMLLTAGDPRGELLQLELDAEAGPLRGLARGRRAQLERELWLKLVPAGVTAERAVLRRTVLVECLLRAEAAADPNDTRWRTVRRLRFDPWQQPQDLDSWRRTPLAGGQLARVEVVEDVAQHALPLLVDAPPLRRLVKLGVMGDLGVARLHGPTDWERLWPAVLGRHPAVRALELGWPTSFDAGTQRLAPLVTADLDRVTVEASPDELLGLHGWRATHAPRFVFEAALRQRELGARVELWPDRLVLRAHRGRHAEAEASILAGWPAHRPRPPLRIER